MPTVLPPAMLTELLKRPHNGFPLVDLYWPSGVRRMGLLSVAALGRGQYRRQLVHIDPIRRVLNRLTNSVEFSPTRIVFEDTSYAFQRELGGAAGHQVRGAQAVVLLASANVAISSWATRFDGFIDTWGKEGPCRWSLHLQPKDAPYRGSVPKTTMLPSDWPHAADKAIYGRFPTIIYGHHDSRGSTDAGMVPCPHVDTILNRYGDFIGHIEIPRVYKNKTLQGSGYSIVRPTINGRKFTLIQFTSPLAAGDVVTADVIGNESKGDGSGSLLQGTDQLLHFLVNFVFNDYQGGDWLSSAGLPISTTSFTAAQTWLTARGWQKSAWRLGGDAQVPAALAVKDFCESKRLYPFFSSAGQLALAFNDHTTTTLWHSGSRFYRWNVDAREPYMPTGNPEVKDRVLAHYLYNSVDGAFTHNHEVRDLSLSEQSLVELPLLFGHHSLSA